jgi:MerR family Zn(II)-responsive transcriptional regulator of zntA
VKSRYKIGELVAQLKINKETVRYYEKIGLLSKPERRENGYRTYTENDLQKLLFILIAKRYGFSLKEIKELLTRLYEEEPINGIRDVRTIIQKKIKETDQKIEELERSKQLLHRVNDTILSMENWDCDDFDNFLSNNA